VARIHGEICIAQPRDAVFDFVADEPNEPLFNRRMKQVELISDGPIGEGSRFAATASSLGRDTDMTIEFTTFDRPARLGSRTMMASITVEGLLTFDADPAGTRMRWSWDIQPTGLAWLFRPLVMVVGERQEAQCWRGLKRLLETGDPAGNASQINFGP
jgi:hypothetical protein